VEVGFGLKNVFTLVTGHLIPTINEAVDEEASAGGRLASGKGFGDKRVILAVSRVYKEIEATLEDEAKLAFGEQRSGERITRVYLRCYFRPRLFFRSEFWQVMVKTVGMMFWPEYFRGSI
jgi:hypothetical protein